MNILPLGLHDELLLLGETQPYSDAEVVNWGSRILTALPIIVFPLTILIGSKVRWVFQPLKPIFVHLTTSVNRSSGKTV